MGNLLPLAPDEYRPTDSKGRPNSKNQQRLKYGNWTRRKDMGLSCTVKNKREDKVPWTQLWGWRRKRRNKGAQLKVLTLNNARAAW